MWTTQRENSRRDSMNPVDIGEIILIVIVFVVGVGGFVYAATHDDKEK